jgi:hypothetical protein
MRYHPDFAPEALNNLKSPDSRIESIRVERAKTFINKEGIDERLAAV